MNYGYADFSDDGVFIDRLKDNDEVLRVQMYHYASVMLAGIHDMSDKTLVDISCGRGGGL
jgi:hypothetical protein